MKKRNKKIPKFPRDMKKYENRFKRFLPSAAQGIK